VSLTALYDDRARANPAGEALKFAREPYAGHRMTWMDIVVRSHAVADDLAEQGVGEAHRAALLLEDHPDLLPALLALWRRRAVVVPVDAEWGEGLREHVLGHSRADFLVTLGTGTRPSATALARSGDRPPVPPGTAMISYTSGSTADPKGVVLGHTHLMHAYRTAARGLADLTGTRPHRFGCALRMSGLGVLGMNYLWAAALGAEVVVLPVAELASARSFFRQVGEHDIDLLYLVPAQAELLMRTAAQAPPPVNRCVCICGSAPLRPSLQAYLQDRFGLLMLNAYGLTEVAFAAFFGSVDAAGKGRPDIGKPVTVAARLRAADGTLPSGEADGELELSGPSMASGYYDNPASTEAVFRDGWVRTGDLARRDAEGRYRITGRLKDIVLKGGFTVYLAEVEDAAMKLQGVLEAAAVRITHGMGEDLGLVLRVDQSSALTENGVRDALHRMLGRSRSPRRIALTGQELPRTGNLKLDRRAVAQLWEDLCARLLRSAGTGAVRQQSGSSRRGCRIRRVLHRPDLQRRLGRAAAVSCRARLRGG
jgi:acyl-CoA synthetase (AMP-forming)/AMP-acid ligase II